MGVSHCKSHPHVRDGSVSHHHHVCVIWDCHTHHQGELPPTTTKCMCVRSGTVTLRTTTRGSYLPSRGLSSPVYNPVNPPRVFIPQQNYFIMYHATKLPFVLSLPLFLRVPSVVCDVPTLMYLLFLTFV